MDPYQKLVMRRKRPLLAEYLNFSATRQTVYREVGLLDDRIAANVMVEKTDLGQTVKFLEQVANQNKSFEGIQTLLVRLDLVWLADEMTVDLLAEKGELTIEDYIYREAGMLVHKHFGKSKRVSETDKKEIQFMMALRYQAAKEASRRLLDQVRSERNDVEKLRFEEKARLRNLVEKVTTFFRIQKVSLRLNEQSHDLTNINDLTRVRNVDDADLSQTEYMELTEKSVDKLTESVSRILLEKEATANERKRCLDVIGVKNCKPGVQLDTLIQDALLRASNKIDQTQQEAEMSDQTARALDERMRAMRAEYDQALMEKTRKVQFLETVAEEREERIRQLERKLISQAQALAEVTDELAKWKLRCETLERTRRLGYLHPDWSKKAYDGAGIDVEKDFSESTNGGDNALLRPSQVPPLKDLPAEGGVDSAKKTTRKSAVNRKTGTKSARKPTK